jgi:hypothetical protein
MPRVTADELLSRLHSDPAWVLLNRKREEAHAAAVAKLREELRPEQDPMLRELSLVGWHVESVWDLVNTKKRYSEAIPVLAAYLPRARHPVLREGIARALTVREARGGSAKIIFQELLKSTGEDLNVRFALANALATTGDASMLSALLDLRADPESSNLAPILELAIQKIQSRAFGRQRKKANKAPEPTTTSVMPRANEGKSK